MILLYYKELFLTTKSRFFRYAETGDYIGPFSKEMIDGAFQPKSKRKNFFGLKTAEIKN